jgi:hypothetical protein
MTVKRAGMQFFKWGGPVVALLLVVWWWFSRTTWISYMGPGDWQFSSGSGRVNITYWPSTWKGHAITGHPRQKGLQVENTPRQVNWWFGVRWEFDHRSIRIPLWFPFLIVVGLTAAAWRKEIIIRRRALIGLCPKCHYTRRGLAATAPCPECGTPARTT